MRSSLFAIAFGGVALLGLPTSAATFVFSFATTGQDELGGGIHTYTGSGIFDGDLQGDGDTILNMSNLSVTYTTGGVDFTNTGNPLNDNPFWSGWQWSLSGTTADWLVLNPSPGGMGIGPVGTCCDGVIPGGVLAFGEPDVVFLDYDPGDFTIAAVPLPASLPVALVGVAAIGWLGRRKWGLSNGTAPGAEQVYEA